MYEWLSNINEAKWVDHQPQIVDVGFTAMTAICPFFITSQGC